MKHAGQDADHVFGKSGQSASRFAEGIAVFHNSVVILPMNSSFISNIRSEQRQRLPRFSHFHRKDRPRHPSSHKHSHPQ